MSRRRDINSHIGVKSQTAKLPHSNKLFNINVLEIGSGLGYRSRQRCLASTALHILTNLFWYRLLYQKMRKKELLNKNSTFVSLDLLVIICSFFAKSSQIFFFSEANFIEICICIFSFRSHNSIVFTQWTVRLYCTSLLVQPPSEPLYAEFLFPESCVENIMPTFSK